MFCREKDPLDMLQHSLHATGSGAGGEIDSFGMQCDVVRQRFVDEDYVVLCFIVTPGNRPPCPPKERISELPVILR
jgi:hypothetical protein